jgi:hypothetical protein
MFSNALGARAGQVIGKLANLPLLSRFYIGGTSAIALHLRHMKPTAVELFTETDEFNDDGLVTQLLRAGQVSVQTQSPGSLAVIVEEVPFVFVSHPFPVLEQCLTFRGVRVAGLLDCGVQTLVDVSGRGAMKDFFDLYCVIRNGHSLRVLLKRVPEKYFKLSYSTYQLLRALVWFENAGRDVPVMQKNRWDWQEIKAFFRRNVKSLMRDFFE